MCGIFGVWERDRGVVDLVRAEEALNTMRHRGPDDEGYLLFDTSSGRSVACGGDDTASSLGLPHLREFAGERFDLILGHRRLAILDTSPAGHQPMLGDRCAIVHSGEIYNFEELGAGLSREWRSGSDTEVLLAGFEAEGPEFLGLLDGMWASAIYDPDRRRLFCSRDRFGMKPFHYSYEPERFLFSSEMKAITAYAGGGFRPHAPSVLDFLAWGMTDHREESFIEGIEVLAPGGSLEVDAEGMRKGPPPTERPWTPDPALPADLQLLSLLTSSVGGRLRSDVTVGTCLSGGLDSSAVVSLAAEARRGAGEDPPMSFTAVFEDPALDEREFAEAVVTAAGMRWQLVTPSAEGLFAALPELTRMQEAPMASSSVYAQWEVMKSARSAGVIVLLDGQGGDELFAGYPQHLDHLLRGSLLSAHLGAFRSASRGTGGIWEGVRRALRDPRMGVPSWVEPAFAEAAASPQPWRYGRNASLLQMLETDLTFRLPSLLRFEERNSMAFGVEARLPFLSDHLLRCSRTMPDTEKIRGGVQKDVLRRAVKGVVPAKVVERRDKIGFATPQLEWLLAQQQAVRETVLDEEFLGSGFVDVAAVRSMFERDVFDADVAWRLLSMAHWVREFGAA